VAMLSTCDVRYVRVNPHFYKAATTIMKIDHDWSGEQPRTEGMLKIPSPQDGGRASKTVIILLDRLWSHISITAALSRFYALLVITMFARR
jgi:hypothetical protein